MNPKKLAIQKNIRSLVKSLTGLVLILCIAFLLLTNEKAQTGNTIQQLEKENQELLKQKQELIYMTTEATSFSELEQKEKTEAMIEPEDQIKTYVTEQDNSVN